MGQLIESQLTNVRICVTSRPETDIKAVLEPLTFHSISVRGERANAGYRELYQVGRQRGSPRRWKQEDKQLVIDVLTERADGM